MISFGSAKNDKNIMILFYSILLVVVGGLTFFYFFNHASPAEQKIININKADLDYFTETYDESRKLFLRQTDDIKGKIPNVKTYKFRVDSNIDSGLFMDMCHIPSRQDTKRLLVLVSGTHGVEGYTGSAIQQMFLNEFLNSSLLKGMGVLLIHSFNPFGQKYYRKTTEFNIDLSRNCGICNSLFESKNTGYSELYNFLCPQGKVNRFNLYNQFFYFVAVWKIIKESISTLRQAALQGQYEYPEGIYYGGKEFAPQTRELKRILPGIFKPYKLIFAIDIHCAYGEWAKLHLFPNPEKDKSVKYLTESLFDGQKIDWGDTADFFTTTGDLSTFLKHVNPDAFTLCMPFEFGTLNSQTITGSLTSIHRMILENQSFNNGFKNPGSKKKVLNDFMEMYYPSSLAWRSEVIRQSRDMLKLCLDRFSKMDLQQ